MKLFNSGEEFEIKFDGVTHIIPGKKEFEVTNESLGNFILIKSSKWGKDVKKTADADKEVIKAINPIIEKPKDEVKEEKKEEPKKVTKAKK